MNDVEAFRDPGPGDGRIEALVSFELLRQSRSRKRLSAEMLFTGATFTWSLATFAGACSHLAGYHLSTDVLVAIVGAAPAILALRMMAVETDPHPEIPAAARALALHHDPSVVWLLLPSLGMFDSETRTALDAALELLLPKLSISRTPSVADAQRRILRLAAASTARAAPQCYNTRLVCALLEALGRLGNKGDIGAVTKILKLSRRRTDRAALEAAAEACLTQLTAGIRPTRLRLPSGSEE